MNTVQSGLLFGIGLILAVVLMHYVFHMGPFLR